MRKNKSKTNFRFISNWLGYCRVYYNNIKNHFFICDAEDTDILNVYCATGDKRPNSKSIDPCITVNGKKTRFYKYVMGILTANGQLIDHKNYQTGDCRKINLRIGSALQNKANTPKGLGRVVRLKGGKYGIVFPDELGIDTSPFAFNTKEEAYAQRNILEFAQFGDWTYEQSQKASAPYNSHEFDNDPYIEHWLNSGTLGEISKLPPNNIYRTIRDNIRALVLGKRVSTEREFELTQKLIHDYKCAK